MSMEKATKKMSNAYKSLGGKNAAIPWDMVIQLIRGLLGGCTTKSAKRFAKNHPIALEFMLKNKLNDDPSGLSPKDIGLVAKAGVKAFNSASPAEIDEMRNTAENTGETS